MKNHKQTIAALRVQDWPNKKGGETAPQRWTGRRIHEDALAADALNAPEAAILAPDDFAEYAQNRYPMNCWYVHGSGMIARHDCDHGCLPTVVGFGRRDAVRFSLVTARCALAVFGANDAIADARFAALETEIVTLVHAAVM